MSTTRGKTNRKTKKGFTLSSETVLFLNAVQKKCKAASVSAIQEEILQAARREYERSSVERAVSDYYSSLSGTERKEKAEWAESAFSQFPREKPR